MRSVRRRIAVISTFFLTIAAVVPAAARKTLVFDEKTGTIFGTPNWKGVRNVVVTATDESGNSKKMSIQITGSRRADFWSAMQCNLH